MRDVTSRLLTVGECALYLKVHQSTIYRLLKKGSLPSFRIGSDYRFREKDLDLWLQQLSRGEIKAPTK
jgi:excisionase family DNA binding protein